MRHGKTPSATSKRTTRVDDGPWMRDLDSSIYTTFGPPKQTCRKRQQSLLTHSCVCSRLWSIASGIVISETQGHGFDSSTCQRRCGWSKKRSGTSCSTPNSTLKRASKATFRNACSNLRQVIPCTMTCTSVVSSRSLHHHACDYKGRRQSKH